MDKKSSSALEFNRVVSKVKPSHGLIFGIIILGALLAFEIFNYSTTDYALTDLLGDLRFLDLRWATILAIAFCAIDFAGIARLFTPVTKSDGAGEAGIARLFTPVTKSDGAGEAGIARLFTPERGSGEPREVWYLFGAWLLAATMNAMLTYWGVTIAILSHTSLGGSVLSQATIVKVVPVFVAIMVWVIRVLIIGSFSVAGERLFSQSDAQPARSAPRVNQSQPLNNPGVIPVQASSFKPAPKADQQSPASGYTRSEPTYHSVSMSSSNPTPPQVRK